MTWKAIKDWQPNHLFYKTVLDDYVKYDTPSQLGFGFTSDGYWREHKDYTRLGKWFRGKPYLLFALVAIPYYLLAWPLWWLFWMLITQPVDIIFFSKWE